MTDAPNSNHTFRFNRWIIWIGVSIGTFIATFDTSVVNVSLPTIAKALNLSLVATQWVELVYMLGVAIFLLPFGHLGDLIGRKTVVVFGYLLFALGLGFAGASDSLTWLMVARTLQAIGGAAFMANGPAIITELFTENRGKAFGLVTVSVSIGSILGPITGGWITQLLGWQWIFWANIPMCLIGALWNEIALPKLPLVPHHDDRFDLYGSLLIAIALCVLILELTVGVTLPWTHPMNWVCVGGLLVSLILFVVHHREAQTGSRPLVMDLKMFKRPVLLNTAVASFFSFIGIKMLFFLVPFYLETVRQFEPAVSGLVLMSGPIALSISAPISGMLGDRFGGKTISSIGMVCSSAGLWMISQFTIYTPLIWVIGGLVLVGMGNGLFYPPNSSRLVSAAPSGQLGTLGGLQAIVRTVGMLIAVVIIGAIYQATGSSLQNAATFLSGMHGVFALASGMTLLNAVWVQFGLRLLPKEPR